MITTLLFDFSRVLIFPKDKKFTGKLNELYREIIKNPTYAFFDHFILNKELLDYAKTLVPKYQLAIFTTDIIQNDKAAKKHIDQIFDKIFSAKELGFSKKDPQVYRVIAEHLKTLPSNILFTDDTQDNLKAAAKIGFVTLHFVSNQSLFRNLEKILNQ